MKRFTLFLGLFVCLCVGKAWGENATITIEDFNGERNLTISSSCIVDGNYVFTDEKGVTFSLSKTNSGNISDYFSTTIKLPTGTKGSTPYNYPFSWSAPENYSITVNKVEIETRAVGTNTVKCRILQNQDGTGDVGTEIHWSSTKKISFNPSSGANSPIYFYYYYSKNAAGATTYISSIKVTYRLTHEEPLFYFTATANTCNEEIGSASVNWTSKTIQGRLGDTSASQKATFTASPEDGYTFKGWGSSSTATSYESTSNPYEVTLNNTSAGSTVDKTLYAIFYKYTADASSINFGDVVYMSEPQTRTLYIDAHNVGSWSTPSGLSGGLSASLSGNADDNKQQTCTVTVRLDPTISSGEIAQTLHITTTRGGVIDIPITANISAKPTYRWNSDIWNAAGTQTATIYVGHDEIENAVSSSSSASISYSMPRFTLYGENNEDATVVSFANNRVSCGQAGIYTLKIEQGAEPNGYDAGKDSVTLEVIKYTPSFEQKITTKAVNQIITATEFVTTTNSDYGVLLSIPAEYAEYAEVIDNKIYTYAVHAGVPVTVTQAENYKWNGATETYNLAITSVADSWIWTSEAPESGKNFYIRTYKNNRYYYINNDNTAGNMSTVWRMKNTDAKNWSITDANHPTYILEVQCIEQAAGYDNSRFRVYSDGRPNTGNNTSASKYTKTIITIQGSVSDKYKLFADGINYGSLDGTQTYNVGVSIDNSGNLIPDGKLLESYVPNIWEFISEDQYNAYYYYTLACEAIQTLVSTYSGEEVDALKVAMVSVLAENDYNSSNSYSERVTNLKEVIANCNSFVAAETHKYTLTVSAAGWSSLCLPFDATLPTDDGFVAYYARSTDGSSITLTPITAGSVKAGEAIIVSAPAGDYVFIGADDGPSKIDSNILQGVTESSTFESGSIYVLAGVDEDGPFFAPLVKEGNAEYAVLPANKAYLQFSTGNAAPQVYTSVVEDNTTTDLQGVSADVPTRKIYRNGQVLIIRGEEIYDMMGRRIQ